MFSKRPSKQSDRKNLISKHQKKKQARRDLQKAKESSETEQFMAALARGEEKLPESDVPNLETPLQKWLFLMGMSAVIIGIIMEHQKTKTSVKTSDQKSAVDISSKIKLNGTTPDGCAHIVEAANNIQRKLPDSTAMMRRLMAQNDFSFVCVKSEAMSDPQAVAQFIPESDAIYYPEKKAGSVNTNTNADQFQEATLDHEIRHKLTFDLHKNKPCQPDSWSKIEMATFLDEMGLDQLPPDLKAFLAVVPVRVPLIEFLKQYEEMVHSDLNTGTNLHLKLLHTKVINRLTLTLEEQRSYEHYTTLLNTCLISDAYYPVYDYPLAEINLILKKSKPMPSSLITSSKAIFTNLRIVKSNEGTPILQGKLKDGVSAHLFRVHTAMGEFNTFKAMGFDLNAYAELDTHLKTGTTDEVLKTFHPLLYAHDQRERDCCEKDVESQCLQMKL